ELGGTGAGGGPARARRGAPGPGRARRPPGAPPRPTLGGRAAARRGGARARPASPAPPRRRAHRQPRSGHRGAGPAAPPRAQSRAWRGAGRRHAQRPAGRSDGADAPSPGRSAAPRGVGGCGAGGRGRRVMSHTAAGGLLGLLLLVNAPLTPVLAAARAATAESAPTVASVGIQGNLRVEEDAIRVHLRSQAGQPYDAETVDSDIRAIYGMGFFDQVRA